MDDRRTAAQLLVARELAALAGDSLPPAISVQHTDEKGLNGTQRRPYAATLQVTVRPEDGFYAGAVFQFCVCVPHAYPFESPRVRCAARVYHPNIEAPRVHGAEDYGVCLSALRLGWNPVHGLRTVLLGLLNMLLEPTAEEPLEAKPASVLAKDLELFARNVCTALSGGTIDGVTYDMLYTQACGPDLQFHNH